MKNLKKLIAIRSDKNCDQIIEYLKNRLQQNVEEILVCSENNTKILVCGINTKLKDACPIVLSGHIDTVSANEKLYETDPYSLTEIGGRAYGLGTIDMKSFTAIVFDNIKKIKSIDCPHCACYYN